MRGAAAVYTCKRQKARFRLYSMLIVFSHYEHAIPNVLGYLTAVYLYLATNLFSALASSDVGEERTHL